MICSATTLAIGMHLNSWHSKYNNEFNTSNPGAFVQYQGYAAGTYYNSIRKQSLYAGKIWDLDLDCRYEVQVGIVSGYATKVLPYVAASIKFDLQEVQKGLHLKVTGIPLYTTNKKIEGIILGASLMYEF
jgi:hypothetical protein